MKYQALRPHFFSVGGWLEGSRDVWVGGWVGGGVSGVGGGREGSKRMGVGEVVVLCGVGG